MRGIRAISVFLAVVCALAAPALAQQGERIASFHSLIRINADASLTVTETIVVEARGQEIRHGIYRDVPTVYPQPDGSRPESGFEVLAVLRNGAPEPWFEQEGFDGVRVYMGEEDVLLPSGRHEYRLTYRTTRQLRFFADHDELYWNVNGNGWRLPADRAAAKVILPPGARMLNRAAYTGYAGERGMDWGAGEDAEGNPVFETTTGLLPRMGLTIVVSFPKGFVAYPTGRQKLVWLLWDNGHWLAAAVTLLFLLGYYLLSWWRVGRDPRGGTVIPRFAPPDGISPAAARYLTQMGFDRKSAGAAVMGLAVKGRLKIGHDDDGEFRLVETSQVDPQPGLADHEAAFLRELFLGAHSVGFERADASRLARAIDALEKRLGRAFDGSHFSRNTAHALAGVALSIVVFFAFVVAAMLANVFQAVFIVGGVVLLLVVLNLLFVRLLHAPTRLGRKVLDEIAGFRMYLETAEEARLNLVNPPERTPELFERYLPYALALDVENRWGEKFQDVLTAATASGGAPYRPAWYDPSDFADGGTAAVTAGLGSGLAASFASVTGSGGASSSGFSSGSGGGSSGGGGGGGGGGGW